MVCPCGVYSSVLKVCPRCGKQMIETDDEPKPGPNPQYPKKSFCQEAPMLCECGNEVKRGDLCSVCGEDTTWALASSDAREHQELQTRPSDIVLMWLIGVAILIVIAGAARELFDFFGWLNSLF